MTESETQLNISKASVPSRTRIEYLDIFRSIGIIFMVLGHIGFGYGFSHFIHAFHMPMFFWISGFLFVSKGPEILSARVFLIKKVKTLIMPYLIFGFIGFFIWVCFNGLDINPLVSLFSDNSSGMPIVGALWFLTALFFVDIIYFSLDRYLKNPYLIAICVLLLTSLGILISGSDSSYILFSFDTALVGLGLFYLGYLIKIHQNVHWIDRILHLNYCEVVMVGLVTFLLIFLNDPINMRSGEYANVALFWINSLLSILVIYNASQLILPRIRGTILGKILDNIGRNSIIWVCMNQIVIFFLSELLEIMGLQIVAYVVIMLIAVPMLLLLITQVITNTPAKIIVGIGNTSKN